MITKNLLTDVAYSNTALYSSKDFPKYNPDDLVGTKGLHIYSKMMNDDQVKVCMRFRRDAATSRNICFELETDEISKDEADKRISLFYAIVEKMPGSFKSRLDCVMSAMAYGYSLVEKVYTVIEISGQSWYGIKSLKRKPAESFRFYLDEYGNLDRLEQQAVGKRIPLNIRKFIHFVFNPDVDEYHGRSELREVYDPWFNKSIITKFRNIHLERFGSGFIWMQPKPETTLTRDSSEWNTLVDMANRLQTATSAIIPSGIDLHIERPQDTAQFKETLKDEDARIARGLLMPNLMGFGDLQSGSRALGEVQLGAFFKVLNAEAQALEECLNEQLFKELGELNFGDGHYPKIKLLPLSDEEKVKLVSQWVSLVTSGAAQATDTDEAYLRNLLGLPEKGAQLVGKMPVPEYGESVDEEPEGSVEDEEDQTPEEDEEYMEETIRGKDVISISAYARKKALLRVAFSVIENKSDRIVKDYMSSVSSAMNKAVELLLQDAQAQGLLANTATAQKIQDLKFNKFAMRVVKNELFNMLKDGWGLGLEQASDEINKAKRAEYKVKLARIETQAASYYEAQAFKITGKMTGDVLAIVQQAILNGIKYSKSNDEIIADINKSLQSAGLSGDAPNLPRLETVIRTNIFEAINEARYNYFTDPALSGFVEAFEYSAVLDSRTTELCEHLDGKVFGTDSSNWDVYRPPNHYNCRSLLVPITQVDTWTKSRNPNLKPAQGFF